MEKHLLNTEVMAAENCVWVFDSFSHSRSLHRTGPFEVSADLEDSMEFVEPEEAGPVEESGDEAVTDEETDLGTDWETVPSPRFCDIPSQPMDLSQSGMQASQPVGNAGGMISSAAASVTSWFRAYTGQRWDLVDMGVVRPGCNYANTPLLSPSLLSTGLLREIKGIFHLTAHNKCVVETRVKHVFLRTFVVWFYCRMELLLHFWSFVAHILYTPVNFIQCTLPNIFVNRCKKSYVQSIVGQIDCAFRV